MPSLRAVGLRISHVTSWASTFLICIMRIVNWVNKPGVVALHSCNPCTSEVRQEDQKSRVFSYTASWSQLGLSEVHKTKTKTTRWLVMAQFTTMDQQSMFFPFDTVFFSSPSLPPFSKLSSDFPGVCVTQFTDKPVKQKRNERGGQENHETEPGDM